MLESNQKAEKTIKSYDIKAIEKIVQDYSTPTAKLWSIKPHQYRIQLVYSALNEVHIISGPVVQIILKWPDVQPNLNTILKRVFSYIAAHKGVLHSVELQPYAHILQQDKNYRGWLTKEFGELSEILPDLLPKKRIKYRKKVIYEAVDVRTGISIEIKDNTGVRYEWDLEYEARCELSRKVKEVEELLREKEECSLERRDVVMSEISKVMSESESEVITEHKTHPEISEEKALVQYTHYQTLALQLMYEH